jgi:hypothetical protein
MTNLVAILSGSAGKAPEKLAVRTPRHRRGSSSRNPRPNLGRGSCCVRRHLGRLNRYS